MYRGHVLYLGSPDENKANWMKYQRQLCTRCKITAEQEASKFHKSVDKLCVATTSDQRDRGEVGWTNDRPIPQAFGTLPISLLPPPRRVQPPLRFLHSSSHPRSVTMNCAGCCGLNHRWEGGRGRKALKESRKKETTCFFFLDYFNSITSIIIFLMTELICVCGKQCKRGRLNRVCWHPPPFHFPAGGGQVTQIWPVRPQSAMQFLGVLLFSWDRHWPFRRPFFSECVCDAWRCSGHSRAVEKKPCTFQTLILVL